MLTIEEYIAKMKKTDRFDEFDYSKQSENMSAVMKYVMSYFNEYLSMETCDAEAIKFRRIADKLEEETSAKYPQSKEFILNFYMQHKIRIHKELDKWLSNIPYFPFYYSEEDFSFLANDFCAGYKIKGVSMNEHCGDIAVLIAEIKKYNTEEPSPSDMPRLDNNLVSWVRETYRQYGVDLFDFAYKLASSYSERYVKFEREIFGQQLYRINNYNHRYNNNPFDIDSIYEDNKHRPFLENKRGELEMLVMHEWLFRQVYDDDYWPEYVNLCVSHGRVNIVKNINALIPVTCAGLAYPEDAPYSTEHIVSTDGVLKKKLQKSYIFRVDISQTHAGVWQNTEEMTALTAALNDSFKKHGAPKVLEITAPTKTASFDEDRFFSCCSLLEKKMKKYSPMKSAIVNGPGNKKTKPISYISTIEDIIELKSQLRERKIRLQFSIDFPTLFASKRDTNYSQNEIFGALAEIKNSIVCMSISCVKPQTRSWPKSRTIGDDPVYYLNRYRYPAYDDFYSMLSVTFNDNQQRYLIPKNISNDAELEILVDNLLRSGFAFCGGEFQDE